MTYIVDNKSTSIGMALRLRLWLIRRPCVRLVEPYCHCMSAAHLCRGHILLDMGSLLGKASLLWTCYWSDFEVMWYTVHLKIFILGLMLHCSCYSDKYENRFSVKYSREVSFLLNPKTFLKNCSNISCDNYPEYQYHTSHLHMTGLTPLFKVCTCMMMSDDILTIKDPNCSYYLQVQQSQHFT